MPRKAREYSALEVKQVKQPGYHFVGGVAGLILQVSDTGSKSWLLRATMGGKQREMGLGGYPDVGLAEAREAAREARQKLKAGIDPIEHKKAARSALTASRARDVTLRDCGLKYIANKEKGWSVKSHRQWLSSLEKHAFSKIGALLVRDVGDRQILDVLEPIWTSKTETATRVRGRLEKIIDWAIVTKLREGPNPARWRGHLEHMLAHPADVAEEEHFKALPYSELYSCMERIRRVQGQGARCLEFAIYTAARSGEARGVTWQEIDFEERVWVVPKQRMKAKRDHRVPLSKAALAVLKAQPKVEGCDFVFPSSKGGPISDATPGTVLKRLKVGAVPHGFRSTFKDWATELTTYDRDAVELALAHAVGDKVEQAYRRGDMFQKRRDLMEAWATFCATPWTARSEVVPFPAAA